MKKQSDTDLQQDYLDAMKLTADHMAADSPARAAEVFSKFAAELKQQSGREFAELRVIALFSLCRMQERLGQTQESERTRQEAVAMLDQFGAPGNSLHIEDRLADVLVEFGEYRR